MSRTTELGKEGKKKGGRGAGAQSILFQSQFLRHADGPSVCLPFWEQSEGRNR